MERREFIRSVATPDLGYAVAMFPSVRPPLRHDDWWADMSTLARLSSVLRHTYSHAFTEIMGAKTPWAAMLKKLKKGTDDA